MRLNRDNGVIPYCAAAIGYYLQCARNSRVYRQVSHRNLNKCTAVYVFFSGTSTSILDYHSGNISH